MAFIEHGIFPTSVRVACAPQDLTVLLVEPA